jgi:hypothetical protein
MMNSIELLANAVASMSNRQLEQLADELVWHYGPRAERLETLLAFGLQDKMLQKEVDTQPV